MTIASYLILAYQSELIANLIFMEAVKFRLFNQVRNISSILVAIAILLSIIFSAWLGNDSLNWQIAMTIVALAIGIPHGAIDHLITLPKSAPLKMAAFIFIYVAIALLAIVAILKWNVWGFIFVVVMSATHFGIGDGAFLNEMDKYKNVTPKKALPVWAYAPAAGALPVMIPLVNGRSTAALEKVNPQLVNWHHGYTNQIQILVLIFFVTGLVVLFAFDRKRDALDLILLAMLAFIAPPLVAFSVYFGGWHALRHTARLASLLPKSVAAYQQNMIGKAFRSAVVPGLPALIGTLLFVGCLTIFRNDDLSSSFLWNTLVTIWALTVPHMLVTARLDRKALSKN
jgi:Brp/Blh family beta-carotene 15,15'-monooxygenase